MNKQLNNVKLMIIIHVQIIGRELESCLQTLHEQTLRECKFLIIHDGHCGDALQVAQEFTRIDSRFDIQLQTGLGCGSAYNYGLQHACTSYVMFIDGWTKFTHNEVCTQFIQRIEQTKVDAVYSTLCNQAYQLMKQVAVVYNAVYRVDYLRKHQIIFQEQVWDAEMAFRYTCELKKIQIEQIDEVYVIQNNHALFKERNVDHCYDIFQHLEKLYQQATDSDLSRLQVVFCEQIFLVGLVRFWQRCGNDAGEARIRTEYCVNFYQKYFDTDISEELLLPLDYLFQAQYGIGSQQFVNKIQKKWFWTIWLRFRLRAFLKKKDD